MARRPSTHPAFTEPSSSLRQAHAPAGVAREMHADLDADAAEPTLDDRPSKSQRKRDMHALQDLGEALIGLSRSQLETLALPENIFDAVLFAQRVKSHEGRRRHLQYLGKLMRTIDAQPLRQRLAEATGESRRAIALMHQCERLRDALLADDAAMTDLLGLHPGIDAQGLRATIRAARREYAAGHAPRHARQLYRDLHELLLAATPEDEHDSSDGDARNDGHDAS